MAQARHGDTVKVHYTGRLEDGSVFDTSEGRDPLSFKLGEGMVIAGFEDAVLGMSPGKTRTEKISPIKAYGVHQKELIMEVERANIPEENDIEVGQSLVIGNEQGQTLNALVIEITEDMVTLDANHPLAGKTLEFTIELVEISSP
ncbi:MAG: peptidylprolyl isomerase [Deltaproteobacteria bacterium]|nr:peptidylprolyl isomerase [Deltaproteobacteria bacterium]